MQQFLAPSSVRSRWPEFFLQGWATAWRWEDASSLLSILFCFSFYSICCCMSPSLFAAVHGRTFSPHGSTQTSTDANTLWLGFKMTSCCCTLFLTLDSIWLLLDIWKYSCDMGLQRTNALHFTIRRHTFVPFISTWFNVSWTWKSNCNFHLETDSMIESLVQKLFTHTDWIQNGKSVHILFDYQY